ncbi:competence type IV pilus ATPase ComGA [Lentibacillus saliphilus]|uniref:competence type IV pilus ATPase ComGA n=1 Tax=Lentibacillus saliphilus TaxID=2737028 RepID=UPI001C311223|nr:competence type IV pilus ATPase ComGA [Lentibacillus saliphilus]
MSSAQSISDALLTEAIQADASDIHFYPLPKKADVFFRIHGQRHWHRTITMTAYDLLLSYYKFTSGMDIGETRKPQNGTIDFHSDTSNYALRLSTLPAKHRESLAIRILPQNKHYELDDLFLFPFQKEYLINLVNVRAGLILLTGPTGSGKTTTLYALLQSLIQHHCYQTITLEDPIEKNINDILQVQVNEKAGMTYQVGLKAALRHDPDIIMVGEIRDHQTARFAFEAALTGHLVLSTLHAKDTIGTVHRLLEMGLSKIEMQQSLIAVAALKLIPIHLNHTVNRRAALLEILDEQALYDVLTHGSREQPTQFHTFEHLKRKAYAYGYITKHALME